MHVAFLNPQGNFDEDDSHLTEHPDFGGQLVYVKEVAKALARMGVEVDIVTRLIDDSEWPEFAAEVDHYDGFAGNPRILRIPCGGPRFLAKEQLWPHLGEFIDNLLNRYAGRPPDFATAHYADGGYCAALLQAKVGTGFTFTGHSLGAQKLDKLGTTIDNYDRMEAQFRFSRRIDAERLSMRLAARVITSTSQERFDQYGHPLYEGAIDVNDDGKFSVVAPGVNTELFNADGGPDDEAVHQSIERRLRGAAKPAVIVSSRLDEKKNIIGVVEAFAGSQELRDAADLGIFVRGLDDPYTELDRLPEDQRDILGAILSTIDDAALRERVFFLNVLSQQELAATYRYFAARGSVFALTSFHEPFGLAPIEAAACGLAVVATRNGGPAEIFADGSGILVDPSDTASIAAGLLVGITSAGRYGELGRRRVTQEYVWERTAAGYLSAIDVGSRTDRPTPTEVPDLDATDRLKRYLGADPAEAP